MSISESQKVNMSYLLFQYAHIYKSALDKWDKREQIDKPSKNYKTHFRNAYRA